jgi:hypothetical protein|nr:MAG TPA: hypothetical protein [Caudoviricetes sp.]
MNNIKKSIFKTRTISEGVFSFGFSHGNEIDPEGECGQPQEYLGYCSTSIISTGVILYADIGLTIPVDGNNAYFRILPGNVIWVIGTDGVIGTSYTCA